MPPAFLMSLLLVRRASTQTQARKTQMPIAQQGDGHHVSDSKVRSVDVDELLDAYDEVSVDDSEFLLLGELEACGGDAVEIAQVTATGFVHESDAVR